MKRKLLFILLTLLSFGTCFVAYTAYSPASTRFHQHRDSAPKEACTHADGAFCTHLPIVEIDTLGGGFLDKEKLACTLTVIDNQGKRNHLGDAPAVASDALINVRGNTSFRFDKKQYRINLTTPEGEGRDVSIMGMPKESNWVLHGPYMDKSLLRSYLMYNVSGEIMSWAPRVRFCEVFVAGEYEGLYLMVEAVTAGPERVNLSTGLDNARQTSYIVCRQPPRADNVVADTFCDYTNHADHELDITYPPAARLTEANIDYIERDISEFERTLYSLEYDDETQGYGAYVNVSSFVDYFIINEFSVNRDAGFVSTYTYRGLRGEINMGPVWDFNNCFDNYIKPSKMDDFHMALTPWFSMMLKDEVFVSMVIARYETLRQGVLSEEYLMAYIDDTIAYLGDAIDRNWDRWGYIFDYPMVKMEDGNPADYEEAVATLKRKIIERGDWLDKNIYLLRQFCAESKVKPYN